MRFTLLAATALMTLAASPAFAQEEEEFDGPYIGVAVGYGFEQGNRAETVIFDRGFNGTDDVVTTTAGTNAFSPGFCNGAATGTANANCDRERDGVDYHARIGYDLQFGSWVVGLVAEGGSSSLRDSVSAFSTTPASYTMTRKIEWDASLRARAGYAFGGTLVYATGGGTYARIENSFRTSNGQNAFSDNGDSKVFGFNAGGGIEHKLSPSVSLGVEYLYTRYQDDEYRVRVTQGIANAINPFILFGAPGTEFRRSDPRFDFHAVRGTLAFRF